MLPPPPHPGPPRVAPGPEDDSVSASSHQAAAGPNGPDHEEGISAPLVEENKTRLPTLLSQHPELQKRLYRKADEPPLTPRPAPVTPRKIVPVPPAAAKENVGAKAIAPPVAPWRAVVKSSGQYQEGGSMPSEPRPGTSGARSRPSTSGYISRPGTSSLATRRVISPKKRPISAASVKNAHHLHGCTTAGKSRGLVVAADDWLGEGEGGKRDENQEFISRSPPFPRTSSSGNKEMNQQQEGANANGTKNRRRNPSDGNKKKVINTNCKQKMYYDVDPHDFLSFIHRHPELSEEFCYMNRVGAYSYQIVPYSGINPDDFLTISIRGVTHTLRTNFLTIAEWKREQQIFHRLQQIPFVQKFTKWRQFRNWKRHTRHERFDRYAEALRGNLFILDPILGKIGVGHPSAHAMNDPAAASECSQIWSLEEFRRRQKKRLETTVKNELEKLWLFIRDEMQLSCEQSLQDFLEQNGFGAHSCKDHDPAADGTRPDEAVVLSGVENDDQGMPRSLSPPPRSSDQGLPRPGLHAKKFQLALTTANVENNNHNGSCQHQPQLTSYTERATRRTQCRKILRFIRYVQQLFDHTILALSKDYGETRWEAGTCCNLKVLITEADDLKNLAERDRLLQEEKQKAVSTQKSMSRKTAIAALVFNDMFPPSPGAAGDFYSPMNSRMGRSPTSFGGGGGYGGSSSPRGRYAASNGGAFGALQSDGGSGGSQLQGPPVCANNKPLFRVDSVFSVYGLTFEPGLSEFQQEVEGCLYDAVSYVTSFPRFLHLDTFSGYAAVEDVVWGGSGSGGARGGAGGPDGSTPTKAKHPAASHLQLQPYNQVGGGANRQDVAESNMLFHTIVSDSRFHKMIHLINKETEDLFDCVVSSTMFLHNYVDDYNENAQLSVEVLQRASDVELEKVRTGGGSAATISSEVRNLTAANAASSASGGGGGRSSIIINTNNNSRLFLDPHYRPEPLADYSGLLEKYERQQQKCQQLLASQSFGLFQLFSGSFKETLLPGPQRCWKLLSEFLPSLAVRLAQEQVAEFKNAHARLSKMPSNVDEYITFVDFLQKILHCHETLQRKTEYILELFEISKRFLLPMDVKARSLCLELELIGDSLRAQITASQEQAEQNVQRFTHELELDIPKLRANVRDCAVKLQNSDLLESDSAMAAVLLDLEKRQQILRTISELESQVDRCRSDAGRYNRYQNVLHVDQTEFDDVEDLKREVDEIAKFWRAVDSCWDGFAEKWKETKFGEIDVELLSREVAAYFRVAAVSGKTFGTGVPAVAVFAERVGQFKNLLPVVSALRNPALRKRHWEPIHKILLSEQSTSSSSQVAGPQQHHHVVVAAGSPDDLHVLPLDDPGFTLGAALERKIQLHVEPIVDISNKATQELSLEEMLSAKVKQIWQEKELNVLPYKDSKDVYIFGELEDIIANLEDSLVSVSTIAGSRYLPGHPALREEVEHWVRNLLLFQEVLDEWMLLQKQWIYLESIFTAVDIKKQLPTESAKFAEIDSQWKILMRETCESNLAITAGTKQDRLETFKKYNNVLDTIQKSLEDYLQSKRLHFPRFFFLSNEELLEILAQSRKIEAVQPHLRKCFDGLYSLKFANVDRNSAEILAMQSSEGANYRRAQEHGCASLASRGKAPPLHARSREEVWFYRTLKARSGNVERWLSEVEEAMCKSMWTLIRRGLRDYYSIMGKDEEGRALTTIKVKICIFRTSNTKPQFDPFEVLEELEEKQKLLDKKTDLTEKIRESKKRAVYTRSRWVLEKHLQVLCTVDLITWCQITEQCLSLSAGLSASELRRIGVVGVTRATSPTKNAAVEKTPTAATTTFDAVVAAATTSGGASPNNAGGKLRHLKEQVVNEINFHSRLLDRWHSIQVHHLAELTDLICHTALTLTTLQRRSIVALVTQDVHCRDIVEALLSCNCVSIHSFKWQQQLRFYWGDHSGRKLVPSAAASSKEKANPNNDMADDMMADVLKDEVHVKQVDAVLRYGYEYIGSASRLVITPLTDRCWLTITGALHLKLGANPSGPAGTGKTESCKDLAKGLARQCVVFNCSEQIDYIMMSRLYCGVCACGSWACLDEFNRISIEVLSVIAQQLIQIRQALLANLSEFLFEGNLLISLKHTCGVCITMNPGYAGRTELPDNLKVLFRPVMAGGPGGVPARRTYQFVYLPTGPPFIPVSMMVPDYTLIAEIMLFAEGFQAAKRLSGKFTNLFKLASEQLSQQDHYDFGMRAVKSVLVMAGNLLKKEAAMKSGAAKNATKDTKEDVLLISAMRDANVPKFLADDLPLFEAIVQDLFPGLEIPAMHQPKLKQAVVSVLSSSGSSGLQVVESQVEKVIQLYETCHVRFGIALVGQTLGGKSTCYKTLAKSLNFLRQEEEAKRGRIRERLEGGAAGGGARNARGGGRGEDDDGKGKSGDLLAEFESERRSSKSRKLGRRGSTVGASGAVVASGGRRRSLLGGGQMSPSGGNPQENSTSNLGTTGRRGSQAEAAKEKGGLLERKSSSKQALSSRRRFSNSSMASLPEDDLQRTAQLQHPDDEVEDDVILDEEAYLASENPYPNVRTNVLNPKCISLGELYGEFSELTQEWRDGLGSSLIRQAADETDAAKQHWITFDGPIDALWIENMNTVLDDNLMLCLASGERIKLHWRMRILFEVQDLAQASPATVSRLGMVYFTSSLLGWRPYVKTWIYGKNVAAGGAATSSSPSPSGGSTSSGSFGLSAVRFTKQHRDLLYSLFDKYVDDALRVVRQATGGTTPGSTSAAAAELISSEDTQLVIGLCGIFSALLDNAEALTAYGCTTKDAIDRRKRLASQLAGGADGGGEQSPTSAGAASGGAGAARRGSFGRRGSKGSLRSRSMSKDSLGIDHQLDEEGTGSGTNGFYSNGESLHGFLQNLDDAAFERWITPVFAFSLAWSIGATVTEPKARAFVHAQFASYFEKMCTKQCPTLDSGFFDLRHGIAFGGGGLAAEAGGTAGRGGNKMMSVGASPPTSSASPIVNRQLPTANDSLTAPSLPSVPTLIPWEELAPTFSYNSAVDYFDLLVPTQDSVRYTFVLDKLLSKRRSAFLSGETGVGKSVLLSRLLQTMKRHCDLVPVSLIFSAQTSAERTQCTIEGKLEKRRKNVLSAPAGTKGMVILVDDVNMPAPDVKRGFKKLNAMVLRQALTDGESGFLLTFKQEVQLQAAACVSATIDVYADISETLLPTPARPHYTFNLRDVSRVFQGILMVKSLHCASKDSFQRLWIHEMSRVFHDRLVNFEDQNWFWAKLSRVLKTKYRAEQWTAEVLRVGEVTHPWGNFGRGAGSAAAATSNPLLQPPYEEMKDTRKLVKLLEQHNVEFNGSKSTPVQLVFFKDAISHITRIARVLSQRRGSLLLVGVGGSGRQSLTRLCCFIMGEAMARFEIELTKSFGLAQFREAEIAVVKLAGGIASLGSLLGGGQKNGGDAGETQVGHQDHSGPPGAESAAGTSTQGTTASAPGPGGGLGAPRQISVSLNSSPTCFLLNENQILHESFLEDVNSLLNAGEVPNLLSAQEHGGHEALEEIINTLRPFTPTQNATREDAWLYFLERVRCNLHVVLAMSPVGEKLRTRLRLFPSLINCTTVDWFFPWPPEALFSVAEKVMLLASSTGSEHSGFTGQQTAKICKACVFVHESVEQLAKRFLHVHQRHVYVTPKSFLDLLSGYRELLAEKRSRIDASHSRLLVGVEKIQESRELVKDLQLDLDRMRPAIQQKINEALDLIPVVREEQEKANAIQSRVEVDAKEVQEQQRKVQLLQAEASNDLNQALPALHNAIKALDALDKRDITEVRSFVKPPPLVLLTMDYSSKKCIVRRIL
eukprot:g1974.t1